MSAYLSDEEVYGEYLSDEEVYGELPDRSVLDYAKDTGVSLTKGVVGLGEAAVGVADIPTMGYAGKGLEKIGYDPKQTQDILSGFYSEQQQEANRKVDEAEGFMGTARAMVDNPSTIAQSVVESSPSMLGGGAIGRGLIAAAPKLAPLIASAMGEGVVGAGSSAESIRQQTEEGTLTPGQSAMALASGAGTSAFTLAGGRLAKKLGFEDVDTLIATNRLGTDKSGIIKRIVGGGISEGAFEELPQSVQEQVWSNAALDKPLMEGVPESGAKGLITGAAMGGGVNVLPSGRPEKVTPPPSVTKAQTVDEAIAAAEVEVDMVQPVASEPQPVAVQPVTTGEFAEDFGAMPKVEEPVAQELSQEEKIKRDIEVFEQAAQETGWNDPAKQEAAQARIDAQLETQRARRPKSRTELEELDAKRGTSAGNTEDTTRQAPDATTEQGTAVDAANLGRTDSAVPDSDGVGDGALENDSTQIPQEARMEAATVQQGSDGVNTAVADEESRSTKGLPITDIKSTHGRAIGNVIAKARSEGNQDVTIAEARRLDEGGESDTVRQARDKVENVAAVPEEVRQEESAGMARKPEGADSGDAKPAWQMTKDEFATNALNKNEYRDQYLEDEEMLAEFNDDQQREWRRTVEEAGKENVLPDNVIDDYVDAFGQQTLISTFRGVAAKGISEWEPKNVRIWDKTYKEVLKNHADRIRKGNKKEYHRDAVKKALSQGKPVPANVLSEYPELSTGSWGKSTKKLSNNSLTQPNEVQNGEVRQGQAEVNVATDITAANVGSDKAPQGEASNQKPVDEIRAKSDFMSRIGDNEQYSFNLYKNGKLVGDGTYSVGKDGVAKIGKVSTFSGANSLGVSAVRRLQSDLMGQNKAIKKFVGDRVTGAKAKAEISQSPQPVSTSGAEARTAPPAKSAKQPWQMATAKEYARSVFKSMGLRGKITEDELANFSKEHVRLIKNAINDGLDVPMDVLQNYRFNDFAKNEIDRRKSAQSPADSVQPQALPDDQRTPANSERNTSDRTYQELTIDGKQYRTTGEKSDYKGDTVGVWEELKEDGKWHRVKNIGDRRKADRMLAEPPVTEEELDEQGGGVNDELNSIVSIKAVNDETAAEEEKRLQRLNAQKADLTIVPDIANYRKNSPVKGSGKLAPGELPPADGPRMTPEAALRNGKKFVRKFVEIVEEFKKAPVFKVVRAEVNGETRTLLRFTDSYRFDVDPLTFGLNPAELTEGQTVRVDLNRWVGEPRWDITPPEKAKRPLKKSEKVATNISGEVRTLAPNISEKEYVKPSSVETPAQGQLNSAREGKNAAWKKVQRLQEQIKNEPIGGNRGGLRLELIKAKDKHREYVKAEEEAKQAIEKRANELGQTTVKLSEAPQPSQSASLSELTPSQRTAVDRLQSRTDEDIRDGREQDLLSQGFTKNEETELERVLSEATKDKRGVTSWNLPDSSTGVKTKGRNNTRRVPGTPFELAENIARIYGKEVRWVTLTAPEIDGIIVRGGEPFTGKIFINAASKRPAHAVLGHELTHWLKTEAPEVYDDLYAAVKPYISNTEKYRAWRKDMADKSVVDVDEEIVADLMGDAFTEPSFWNDVALEAGKSKFRKIAGKIRQWVQSVLNKIKGFFDDYDSKNLVIDLNKTRSALAKAAAQYEKAIADAAVRREAGSDARGMVGDVMRSVGQKYPLAKKGTWYGDEDYKERGGRLVYMSPDEYISSVKSLEIDETSRENIDDLKQHINDGGELDPLAIYANGKEDGRHRAYAAKELGIKQVPVLDFRPAAGSVSRSLSSPMPTSANFRKWFGSSVVRVPVFHGSPSFGKTDNFTFDPDRPGPKTATPGAGLGTFFTEDRTESLGYAGTDGESFPMWLRIENPLKMNSYEIPNFNDRAEAAAFRRRKMLQGYDGIRLKDLDHWIIFEPGQAKSADRNSGEYSRKNNDIRFSVSSRVKGSSFTEDYGTTEWMKRIQKGKQVTLEREPDNAFDKNAVKVFIDGVHYGYVARDKAVDIAQKIDEGVPIKAVISQVFGRDEKKTFNIKVGTDKELSAKPLKNTPAEVDEELKDVRSEIEKNGITPEREGELFDDMADTPPPKITERIIDEIKALPKAAARNMLGALTLRQLREIYGKKFFQMKNYYAATQMMDADTNRVMNKAEGVYTLWDKLDKKTSDRLALLMSDATYQGVDPAQDYEPVYDVEGRNTELRQLADDIISLRKSNDPDKDKKIERKQNSIKKAKEGLVKENRRKADHGRLKQRFDALPQNAKDVYIEVRDMYTANLKDLRKGLEDRVMRNMPDTQSQKMAMDAIRLKFDQYLKEGPYFPMARFGDYIVILKNGDEKEVHTFDFMGERDRFVKQSEKEGWTVKTMTAKEYSPEADGASVAFVEDVVNAISKSDMNAAAKSQLIDEVNQAFIKAMPDLSHRKHFIHRKKVEGYSRDQLRAFATNMQHAAHHIARVKHADKMTRAITDIDDLIKETDEGDVSDATDLRNELIKRNEQILNPKISPVAQALTSLGFVFNIGPSIASAVVNVSQTALVTFPFLSARHGSGMAFKALRKASTEYFSSPWEMSRGFNMSNSSKLTADEKTLLKTLEDDGTLDISLARSLAQATGPDALNFARTKHGNTMVKAMRVVSYPFHVAELANRQISAVAAYRLAREGGLDHDQAIDYARDAVSDTHFDYSAANRARWMEGNTQRVLFLFKQYSQQMTFLLGRSFQQAVKGEDAAVKKIARKQLSMIIGGHFLVSGMFGLPVVGTIGEIMSFFVAALGDDDDPWDWETELRKILAETLGKDAGEAIVHGPWRLIPGLGALDISSRVSLGDLWLRSDDRETEGIDTWNKYLNLFLGPLAANGAQMTQGLSAMSEGKFDRGVEMMLPKFLKDALKMVRYSREGVKSWNDAVLMDDLNTIELAGQALGFTPARVSEMYEGKSAIKNLEKKLQDRKERLVNQWVSQTKRGDTEGARETMREMVQFSRKNPEFKITPQTRSKAMKNQARTQKLTKQGVYLPRTREALRDEGGFANVD